MEIELATKENYHDQKNDGSFKLLEVYKAEAKAVDCFWNACAFGLEVTRWVDPKDKQWKKIQFPDYALMVQYNTKHLSLLENVYDDIDPHFVKLNEFPKFGVVIANKVIFEETVMYYSDNANSVTFDIIREHIKNKNPVVTSSHLYGGHFICYHAIDNNRIGYSDSYNGQWLNWWTEEEFFNNVKASKKGVTKDYCKIWFPQKNTFTLSR